MNLLQYILLSLTVIHVATGSSIPHRISANTLFLYGSRANQTAFENQSVDHIIYGVNAGFGPSKWADGSLDFLAVVSVDCCTNDAYQQQELPNVSPDLLEEIRHT
jgi:hypothetical protein